MKTSFEIRMGADKTFDEIAKFMNENKLKGGYGWNESILSRDKNSLILRCHFRDDRMALRDILERIDRIIADTEGIYFKKIEISED